MTRPEHSRLQRPRAPRHGLHAADLLTSALVLVAIAVAATTLSGLLQDFLWWWQLVLVAAVIIVAAAVARPPARAPWVAPLASAAAGVIAMTALFAPETALFGLIPTLETLEAAGELAERGWHSIATQRRPAEAVEGIRYLLCLGFGGAALAMDAAANAFKAPALAGAPLLALVLIPTFVLAELHNPLVFGVCAMLFLALLLTRSRRTGLRTAAGVGAVALLASLTVPIALPDARPAVPAATGGTINPIVALGNDLRRDEPTVALVYETSAPAGVYLRIAALDDLRGQAWEPRLLPPIESNTPARIGPAPGLGDDVAREQVITGVSISRRISSAWLPAPYAPTSVTGAFGDWTWEPDGLGIRAESADARGQEYLVESLDIRPTVEQLQAARTLPGVFDRRYLDLPGELPAIVRSTAREVTAETSTPYERAVALQAFFRSGQFDYSEQAPVEQGYDGSGAEVLAEFLEVRSGYCVHFASAMAAMARSLGIPARVAVGFVPGTEFSDEGVIRYRVSTHDLHAWPELFFEGVGWVRFEPTPGRGTVPAYSEPDSLEERGEEGADPQQAEQNDAAPTSAPTAAPGIPQVETDIESGPEQATVEDTAVNAWPLAWLAAPLVLLFVPALARLGVAASRMRAVRRGSARAAWAQLHDAALDLRLLDGSTLTPREFAAALAPRLRPLARESLQRLLSELEGEVFAGDVSAPAPRDVRRVRRGLRRTAGPVAVARELLVPRSVLARFTAVPVTSG